MSNRKDIESIASADKALIQTVGATISKMTLFICCAVVAGMVINTCKVDEEIIVQCEESCGSTAGIKEVTGTSCTCNTAPTIGQDPWVLPRN